MRPLLPERSSFTDMDILLHNLFPVGSLATELPPPAVGHHGSTVVCFSCGESGHPASRCPTQDDTFPFLTPGGKRTGRVMDLLYDRPRRRLTYIRRDIRKVAAPVVVPLAEEMNLRVAMIGLIEDGSDLPAEFWWMIRFVIHGWQCGERGHR